MRATQNAKMCALAMTLLLGGCGRSDNVGSNAGGSATASAAAGSGWDAYDACSSLGRDNAAAAGGAAVTDARLEKMSAGGGGLAVTSMCTFTYANGATLMVLTREAPDADATSKAIEDARTGGGVAPPANAVPGLGRAAFWSSAGQAQLFIDDRRYVVINFFKLPAGEDIKARSFAVAKAFL